MLLLKPEERIGETFYFDYLIKTSALRSLARCAAYRHFDVRPSRPLGDFSKLTKIFLRRGILYRC